MLLIMRSVVAIIFIVLASCSTSEFLTEQTFNQEVLSKQLEVGDRIVILTDKGEEYKYFKVVTIDQRHLECRHRNYGHITFPYSSIKTIIKEHPEPRKTVILILGIGLGLVTMLVIAVGASFANQ